MAEGTETAAVALGLDYEPVKGDRLAFDQDGKVYAIAFVNRVSQGKWADIEVYSVSSRWTKRQPLPWRVMDARLAGDGECEAVIAKRREFYGE